MRFTIAACFTLAVCKGRWSSIGNLSVGGSGKTPFVILLGKLLKERGIKFDILSRGYGRQTKGTAIVEPPGSAREFGDEPLLMSRHLGVPVVLGEDRYEAGLLAEKTFGPQWHLLDDGFQHRGLARDFDIVLIPFEDAHDRLMPAGRLREPLSALQRADVVVVTNETSTEALPLGNKPVWRIHRGIVAQHIPQRPVAFCGIARPQNFFQRIRRQESSRLPRRIIGITTRTPSATFGSSRICAAAAKAWVSSPRKKMRSTWDRF